jgi:hypothetical protein
MLRGGINLLSPGTLQTETLHSLLCLQLLIFKIVQTLFKKYSTHYNRIMCMVTMNKNLLKFKNMFYKNLTKQARMFSKKPTELSLMAPLPSRHHNVQDHFIKCCWPSYKLMQDETAQ